MKKQDIRIAYTQKVTELLNQGYTIFPDTMNGSQGEIAHIDLTDGSQIYRVLLDRDLHWAGIKDGFTGDIVRLTVGRAAPDTRVTDYWDGTIWNNRLEPSFEIAWAEVQNDSRGEWYIPLDAAAEIGRKRRDRYARRTPDRVIHTVLGKRFHTWAVAWVRRQPRMKSCRPEDVRIDHCQRPDGRRYFEITAKGHTWTLGR